MVAAAAGVDWVTVATEVEALQLEYAWIKEYDPRFNVRYRDDKSYPFLAVTLDEEYPRLMVMRGAKRKGVRYFGPYSHAWAIRETLDLLLRVFPARTCSAGVFKRHGQIGRPCLLGDIGKCSAPCVGRVTAEEHRQHRGGLLRLHGRAVPTGWSGSLEKAMRAASDELEFERAARLRDDLAALRRAMEKQTVVFSDGTDADVVAFAEDPLEAAVQVFHVRAGRVRGQRGWVVEKTEELTTGDLVHHFCTQVYGGEAEGAVEADLPREMLVPELPADAEALADWLSGLRGAKVALRVPQRGDKKTLMETVARNAGEALTQHKLRRAGDLTARSQALEEIAEALGLPRAPLRIECFDVSQIQGTDVVASMVVFEDGLARKAEYRRFIITGATDDVSAISEVLRRRFARYLAGREPTGEPSRRVRQAGDRPGDRQAAQVRVPAELVVVDGGAPQVNAAGGGAARSWASPTSRCAGWPSGWRRCGCPTRPFPVILPRTSEGLYLLQRVRDEAHRFAITFHRQRRSKRMTASALDGCRRPGRDPAQGPAAPVRLAEAARRRQRGGDRRGAGHRPAYRGGYRSPRCAVPMTRRGAARYSLPAVGRSPCRAAEARDLPDRRRRVCCQVVSGSRGRAVVTEGGQRDATGRRRDVGRASTGPAELERRGRPPRPPGGTRSRTSVRTGTPTGRTPTWSSSPGSPAAAAAPWRGRWRTSASTWSTTCRRR